MRQVGQIAEQPRSVNGNLVSHEYRDLTIIADHDDVDGAPVARLASRLRELVGIAYSIREVAVSAPSRG